jgi:pimeloyl-ACP methyl ester carboxylesterase
VRQGSGGERTKIKLAFDGLQAVCCPRAIVFLARAAVPSPRASSRRLDSRGCRARSRPVGESRGLARVKESARGCRCAGDHAKSAPHRTPTAGLCEDADEVRHAIRVCAPPTAAVGWSYGGSVMSLAAAGEGSVTRLISIADIPRLAGFPGEDLGWIDADPHEWSTETTCCSEVDRKCAESV